MLQVSPHAATDLPFSRLGRLGAIGGFRSTPSARRFFTYELRRLAVLHLHYTLDTCRCLRQSSAFRPLCAEIVTAPRSNDITRAAPPADAWNRPASLAAPFEHPKARARPGQSYTIYSLDTWGARGVGAGLTPFTLWTRKVIRGGRWSYTSYTVNTMGAAWRRSTLHILHPGHRDGGSLTLPRFWAA